MYIEHQKRAGFHRAMAEQWEREARHTTGSAADRATETALFYRAQAALELAIAEKRVEGHVLTPSLFN